MSLSEKQEKALLAYMRERALHDADRTTDYELRDKARAYLATLEPKPEPKRGVEEILREVKEEMLMHAAHIAQCDWAAKRLIEALRLYREERERVERALDYLPHTPHVAESILKGRAI